uniref:Uncharacterized protein n=1 Tax=Klebsiella pneumoniae TaxID=573 RepID=A0A7G5F7U2_KLEPN|nr:hypothetical protein [Klebsiella pneumoniae]
MAVSELNAFRYQLHNTVHHFGLYEAWTVFKVGLTGFLYIKPE